MKSTFCITIVLLFFMDVVLLAEVPRPINVRIASINMELLLQWDAAPNVTAHTTYTAEYMGFYPPYKAVCRNITAHYCDFTDVLRPFGMYTFRVKAELQGKSSTWVEMSNIVLDQQTDIGPPSVILNASGLNIEVTIKDPVFRIKTFRDIYPRAVYNISYWEKDQRDMAVHYDDVVQLGLALRDLKHWTTYCVQAQVKTFRFHKLSTPSAVVCETTAGRGGKAWVVAVVVIVLVAVMVGLVVCGVLYGKKIVRFIWPKVKLPKHFKEYLWEPHGSPVFLAVQTSPPPEEVFHPVSVMEENTLSELPSMAEGLSLADHEHQETNRGGTGNRGSAGRAELERIADGDKGCNPDLTE